MATLLDMTELFLKGIESLLPGLAMAKANVTGSTNEDTTSLKSNLQAQSQATQADGQATHADGKATQAQYKATQGEYEATQSEFEATQADQADGENTQDEYEAIHKQPNAVRRQKAKRWVMYVRVKRRERAKFVVLSSDEMYGYAKAIFDPVVERL